MFKEFKNFIMTGNVIDFADLHIAMDGQEYVTLAAAKEAGGAVIAY